MEPRDGIPESLRQLQKLLQYRRAQVDPTEHGFPRRSRRGRRADGLGLTQGHMDALLGSPGSGTYGALERGDLTNPPPELLREVARILKFDEDEWAALWALTRQERPPYPLYPRADQRIDPSWQSVLDAHPHMAYITDRGWNLLMHNAAFAEMFESGQPPENTMEYMVLSDEGRRTLAEWETHWAPQVLSQLRNAYAEQPHNPTLRSLVERVRQDPQAGPIYAADPRAFMHPDGDTRPFRHLRHGPGRVQLNAAGPYGSPGARLIFVRFIPDPA